MTVYRKINPTPFRGISVNIYTNDGVKSYMLNSGLRLVCTEATITFATN